MTEAPPANDLLGHRGSSLSSTGDNDEASDIQGAHYTLSRISIESQGPTVTKAISLEGTAP